MPWLRTVIGRSIRVIIVIRPSSDCKISFSKSIPVGPRIRRSMALASAPSPRKLSYTVASVV